MQHWIAFQLLHALAQCHERGVCHGDIKCENVLVTSWDWVYLADFASYKPVRLLADNPVSNVLCYSLPTDSDVCVGASHKLMVMLLVLEASDSLYMHVAHQPLCVMFICVSASHELLAKERYLHRQPSLHTVHHSDGLTHRQQTAVHHLLSSCHTVAYLYVHSMLQHHAHCCF